MIVASHVKWKHFLVLIPLIGLIRTHKLPEFMNTPFWILDNNQIISSPQVSIVGKSDRVFKLAQPHGIEYIRGLRGRSKESFTTSQENQRYIFPHHINLKYSQAKDVQSATLILNNTLRSNPAHFDKNFTYDTIRFEFPEAIRSGTYKARLELYPPLSSIKVETKLNNKNEHWLLTTNGLIKLSYLDFLESIFYKSKVRFSLIVSGLIALFFLPTVIQKKHFHKLMLTSLILSVISITDPMSGYDETAHIDLMHQSLRKNAKTELLKEEFLKQAFNYMIEHDFYFLHKLQPVPNQCPHKVIGFCGSNDRAKKWYDFLSNFLPKINSITYFTVSHTFVSLAFLIIYLIISNYFFSIDHRILITLIIFSGCLWSTIPSVTNDIPIYFYGLTGLSIITFNWISSRSKALKIFLSLAWIFGSYYFIRQLDRSWIICLFACPLLFLSSISSPLHLNQKKHSFIRAGVEVLGFLIIATLIAYVTIKFSSHLEFRGVKIWDYLANNIDPVLLRVHKSALNLSIESAKFVLVEHTKSLFGSFVWGHSYYKNKIYWLLSLSLYWLSVEGWNYLRNRISKRRQIAVATSITLTLSCAFMTILLISLEQVVDLTFSIESYTKIRLIAPILSIYLFLPSLGVLAIFRHKLKDMILKVCLYSYICKVCIWYLPQFFFYDKFW